MSSLDVNLVLRLLLEDHPGQTPEVISLLESGRAGEFEVADAVLFECVWVMQGSSYDLDRRMISDLLMQLTKIDRINCNRALIERVVPRFVHHPSVSFMDACLATYAELNDALPLLTYDKKLARAFPRLVKLLS